MTLGTRTFMSPRSLPWLLAAVIVDALLVMLTALPGVARADVSQPVVTNSLPTAAAGGRTIYSIAFNTSPTGGLSGALGDQITVNFPSGTDITHLSNTSVKNGAGTIVGFCNTANLTATCVITGTNSIGNSSAVTVELDGVINPAANSYTVSVKTTKDQNFVSSASYSVVGANQISTPAVTVTPPTNAAGGRTIYSIGFNTSTTGALSGTAGSTITITFQSGDITHLSNTSVKNGAGTIVGFCNTANLTATCVITGTNSIGNSSAVTVELDGVINPAANSYTASVFTTSDPSSVPSTSYTIVSAHQISTPAVTVTPPTNAAGGRTIYSIGFNTSTTGALSGTAGSTITITFQSGDITHLSNTSVKNGAGTIVGFCNTANLTATCVITGTNSIGNSSAVTVELDGVINPAANSYTASVFTTSDPSSVPSTSYTIVSAHQISTPAVTVTPPTNAAGGRTIYSIGFNTSTTGALSGTAGSTITITFQSGDITHLSNTSVKNGAGTIVGFCNTANLTATCVITGTNSIGNSSAVTVELDGVINPAANSYTASVFTTSDPSSVPSTSYTIVSAHQISTPTFTQSSNAPGAANVTDRIAFNTSGTGALSGTAGSTITITFQSGTDITHLSNTSVKNGGGTIVGFCNTANLTATCVITGTNSIGNSSAVTVELDGVTNPPSSGPVSVFTTSDPGAVPSGSPANVPPTPPPAPPPPSTPPAVSGGAPTTQTSNTAAVSGTINPENQATTAFFQYGLDLSQRGPGSTTTLYDESTPPQQVGSDQTNHTVTAPLTGLIPGGLYHVRLVATNSAGTTFGPDQTFTTAQAAAPAPPVLGKSADLTPVSGKVFIKNASGQFIALTGATQIPSGAVVDALHGTLKITTALPGGPRTTRPPRARSRRRTSQSGTSAARSSS